MSGYNGFQCIVYPKCNAIFFGAILGAVACFSKNKTYTSNLEANGINKNSLGKAIYLIIFQALFFSGKTKLKFDSDQLNFVKTSQLYEKKAGGVKVDQ